MVVLGLEPISVIFATDKMVTAAAIHKQGSGIMSVCREGVLETNALSATWTRTHTPQVSHIASHCELSSPTNSAILCSKES